MLWNLSQRTFNGGQLDGRLMGRTDLAKYYQGASVLQNFIVKRQGCISRRPGTRIVHTIDDVNFVSATHFRLIPFAYDLDLGYVIVLYATDYGTAKCVIRDSGGELEAMLNVPYVGKAIEEIEYCQSGDTIFLAHRDYPFSMIRHDVADQVNAFAFSVVDFSTLNNGNLPQTPRIKQVVPSGFSGEGPAVTVDYGITAVKDGVESTISPKISKTYNSPWTEGATMKLTIDIVPLENVDRYFVYKRRNGRNWGFIGSVENGLAKYYTGEERAFNSSNDQEGGTYGGDESYALNYTGGRTERDKLLFKSSKPVRCNSSLSNNGVVIAYDTYRFMTWNTAKPITSIHIPLGYAMRWPKVSGYGYYGQFLPCLVDSVSVFVTFEDGSHRTIRKKVPEAAKADDIRIEGESASEVDTFLLANAPDEELSFELYASDEQIAPKKVVSIDITGENMYGGMAVGSLNIPNPAGSGYAEVNGLPLIIGGVYFKEMNVASRTTIYFVDDYIEPEQSVTPPKYEPFFNEPGNYPGCVTLYQQRLVLASTHEQPFTFWMSCVGDLYNFNVHDSLREDDAIEVTLPALKYPNINHMVVNRDLVLFCDNGEWIVSPVAGNAMTYATVSTKLESQIGGSATHQPITVGNDVLFVNSADETVVATKYDFTSDSYGTQDLSVLSHDVFRNNPITSIAYQKDPDSLVIATLRDGSFATLTYMKEHEVVAWSVHRLANGARALAVCTDGSMEDGSSNAFLLDSHGHLLRFSPVPERATDPLALGCLDCSEVKSEATVVAEGRLAVGGDAKIYASGMTAPAGSLHGIPFESRLITVRPEPSPRETVQFEVKNPTHVDVRVHAGSTFRVGQNGMDPSMDRTLSVGAPAESGGRWIAPDADLTANVAGANNRDGRMRLVCDGPWPLTVLMLNTTYQVEKADQNAGGR